MSDYETRFGGVARLFSTSGLQRLASSHVCVVGIGGVGCWTAEALVRSGIGKLTLVDLDEICVSNVNRQLHALDGEIGQSKVQVMARRCLAINPGCNVHPIEEFFTAATSDEILSPEYDYVIDAIDNVTNKSFLIAASRARRIPVLTVGAAGGRRDPTAIRVSDLAESTHDPLLQEIRRRLRREHGFPAEPKTPFQVAAVFSPEPMVYPQRDGTVCGTREPGTDLRLSCESGYGSACFVTGAFGFAAAGHVVAALAKAPAA
jgi:tRNA A37 threonylcarbamoyladenosine dehydratase